MDKVIVNSTVAGWIAKYNSYTTEEQLRRIMNDIYEDGTNVTSTMKVYLEEQNIDIVTLVKAIQYGYEVPYEFKEKDLVLCKGFIFEFVSKEDGKNILSDGKTSVSKPIDFELILVCKAEDRRDLENG